MVGGGEERSSKQRCFADAHAASINSANIRLWVAFVFYAGARWAGVGKGCF